MRKLLSELKIGDGIIVYGGLGFPVRAVVARTPYIEDGVSVDLEQPDAQNRHFFYVGSEFEIDPQGAWAEVKPFTCQNPHCYFHNAEDYGYLKDKAFTALPFCPNCGTPLEVAELPVAEPVFSANTLKYKRVWELKEKIEHRNLNLDKLQEEANMDCAAEHKKLFPRKKKMAWLNLPEDVRGRLLDKWQPIARARFALKKKHLELVEKILYQLAPTCELTPNPQMFELKTSDTYSYNSQGWGASKYAQGALVPMRDLLYKHGFRVRIATKEKREYGTTYALMGNLTPWQFDAFSRVTKVSEKEWVKSQNDFGCNAKVYNPWTKNSYDD